MMVLICGGSSSSNNESPSWDEQRSVLEAERRCGERGAGGWSYACFVERYKQISLVARARLNVAEGIHCTMLNQRQRCCAKLPLDQSFLFPAAGCCVIFAADPVYLWGLIVVQRCRGASLKERALRTDNLECRPPLVVRESIQIEPSR